MIALTALVFSITVVALRRLATRPLPTGRRTDGEGQVRLVVPQYDFADLLAVAVAEIWHYGRDSTQVPERLAALLRDLRSAALPEHLPAVAHWENVLGVTDGSCPVDHPSG